jgi:hypothetical protein
MPKLRKTFKIKGGIIGFLPRFTYKKKEDGTNYSPQGTDYIEDEIKRLDERVNKRDFEKVETDFEKQQEITNTEAALKKRNEKAFNKYVDHEWNLCNSRESQNYFKLTPRNFDDFKKKIQADKSYDTTKFTDDDYNRLFSRCSSANKEEFSDKLRQTEEGKFILNPRTGGKRNKTRKNKRKSKTYKKSRK